MTPISLPCDISVVFASSQDEGFSVRDHARILSTVFEWKGSSAWGELKFYFDFLTWQNLCRGG